MAVAGQRARLTVASAAACAIALGGCGSLPSGAIRVRFNHRGAVSVAVAVGAKIAVTPIAGATHPVFSSDSAVVRRAGWSCPGCIPFTAISTGAATLRQAFPCPVPACAAAAGVIDVVVKP